MAIPLRIVSGFTAREIGQLFLTPETAIAQRLSRTRRKRQIDSPVVTINAGVARAFAGLPAEALKALEALNDKDALRHYAPYHIARAEILRLLGRDAEAAEFYELAMSSGASAPVIEHLKERLATSL